MGKRKKSGEEDEHIKEWSRDDIMKLINLIHDNEFLWNPKHEDFHKKQKRTDKIDEFVVFLDNKYSNGDIRFKWRNLRNYFAGEVSKERFGKRSGSGLVNVYQSSWEFYKAMEFVRDVMSMTAIGDCSANAVAAIEQLDTNYACPGGFGRKGSGGVGGAGELQAYANELFSVKNSSIRLSATARKFNDRRSRKKKNDQKNLANSDLLNINKDFQSITNSNEAFGKHVALSLEALPAYGQAWVKFEIQKILFRAVCEPTSSGGNNNDLQVLVAQNMSPPIAAATAHISQQHYLPSSRFHQGFDTSLGQIDRLSGASMQMS